MDEPRTPKMNPLSPPMDLLDRPDRLRQGGTPRNSELPTDSVKKLLSAHYQLADERGREYEQRALGQWFFAVKRAHKVTTMAGSQKIAKARRLLLIDTEHGTVSYLKMSGELPGKPFPRSALNVSSAFDKPKACDFVFAEPWKGRMPL